MDHELIEPGGGDKIRHFTGGQGTLTGKLKIKGVSLQIEQQCLCINLKIKYQHLIFKYYRNKNVMRLYMFKNIIKFQLNWKKMIQYINYTN